MNPPSHHSLLRAFLTALRSYADRGYWLSAGAIIVLGIVEAGTLLLGLPLLHTAGVGDTPPAGALGRIIDQLHALGLPRSLPGLLAVFLCLTVVRSGATTLLARLNARIQSGFVHFLRDRLHRALVRADWPVFLSQRPADIVRVIGGETSLCGNGASLVVNLVSNLLQTVAQITVAWLVSPTVTVVSLSAGLIVLFLLRPLVQRVRRESWLGQVDRGALSVNIAELVAGLKLAKAHATEGHHSRHFADIITSLREREVRIAVDQARATASFNLGAAIALAGFLWFAVAAQDVRGAEFALLALVFLRLASRMMSIQTALQRFAVILPAFGAVEQLERTWQAAATSAPVGEATAPPLGLRQSVDLFKVSFSYPNSDRPALREVRLSLPAARIVALCGPSGAGKSTLADLVLGLLNPTSGSVSIDGEPLTGELLHRWRGAVAYVPQEPFLFDDTVRANLSYLAPDANESEMRRVLAATAALELVDRLPQGLDTRVGDRGIQLSGGERQRLTLARALLRRPTLLVLDEATSSLDVENEQLIHRAIDQLRGQTTVLVIAHRLSTIRHADQIVVLESGRIVQTGTWDDLSRKSDGAFARMIEAARV